MTYAEYTALIAELKRENENRIITIIPAFEELAYEGLLRWMEENLEIKRGYLITSPETIQILNQFDTGYLKVLNEIKLYSSAVSDFVKSLPKLANAAEAFQVKTNKIDWKRAGIPETQKIVVSEILKAYKGNGINSKFIQPIRDQIYQNVAAGSSLKEVKASLKEYVKSGKAKNSKLKRYLNYTTLQAVDGYTGAINTKLMKTFEFPYVIMTGSLIETSSPQCVYGIEELDGIFTKEEFEKQIKPIAENNGLISGTTFENLDFNKLHHACRHDFTPSMVRPGDRIGTKETFKR